MIRYQKDPDKIVTLTLDMTGRDINILNHEIIEAFVPVLGHLKKEKERGELKGVIITSAKTTFLAGGDLDYLYRAEDPKQIFQFTEKLKHFFRELEKPGVPVVAAINGTALATGFELSLACHHRIVLDQADIQLGFPEVRFGIMPGNGGVIRLMWLLGIEKAFSILSIGHRFGPGEALREGMVDELASNPREMIGKAKAWILQTDVGRRKWDRGNESIPGGTCLDRNLSRRVSLLAAGLSRVKGGNNAAKLAILNTLTEGSKVDFDTALRIESRQYTKLLRSPAAKNMFKAFWLDENTVLHGISRPGGFGRFRPRQAGIIGAGQMGSGIAFVCAQAGIQVAVKDISKLVAERARDYVAERLEELVARASLNPGAADRVRKKVRTTDTSDAFADCDLVIEAVFENEALKTKVLREAEARLDDYAIIGTNTLSIPISKLAKSLARPEQFVGIHFFSPPDQVPLVEIVRGERTSEETIARALDFARTIGKIPILVKDDWGFYVMRVQNTYILEGLAMLQEGYAPALVENAGKLAGMPTGPLKLADQLGLEFVLKYERQAAAHYGPKYIRHPAVTGLEKMLERVKRPGKVRLRGFYDWPGEGQGDGAPSLWEGLTDQFPNTLKVYDLREMKNRLLIPQVIEAVWCLQEGVIRTVPEANLGSIHGWGFPATSGGVIQLIRKTGHVDFLEMCHRFEARFGPRFRPPAWMKDPEKLGIS